MATQLNCRAHAEAQSHAATIPPPAVSPVQGCLVEAGEESNLLAIVLDELHVLIAHIDCLVYVWQVDVLEFWSIVAALGRNEMH